MFHQTDWLAEGLCVDDNGLWKLPRSCAGSLGSNLGSHNAQSPSFFSITMENICVSIVACIHPMAIRVVEFSNGGYKIRKKIGLRINIPKGNFWILRIGLMGRSLSSLQKLEFLKLIISFFHYFWWQNWDQCHKWVEKTPIYIFSTFDSN